MLLVTTTTTTATATATATATTATATTTTTSITNHSGRPLRYSLLRKAFGLHGLVVFSTWGHATLLDAGSSLGIVKGANAQYIVEF